MTDLSRTCYKLMNRQERLVTEGESAQAMETGEESFSPTAGSVGGMPA
jgi:hypothetical protein